MRCSLDLRVGLVFFASAACLSLAAAELQSPSAWPSTSRQTRPWTYWWWMGSAVDQTNLTRELHRYRDAGLGGVHIIPIYGAKGFEEKFIPYLTPQWLAMLEYTIQEADRLDLGVDMTTGSGWCFGGPRVTDNEANASVMCKVFPLAPGARLAENFDPKVTQALMGFSNEGKTLDLAGHLTNGVLDWSPAAGRWRVYVISQKPSGQKVKRAGTGGQGHMLNPFYPAAMRDFLAWFDDAFSRYAGPMPRAFYHDSYEYRSDWSPDFFAAFEQRRGYRLQSELPALFDAAPADSDRAARVKCDYRETISDLMAEETLPMWARWARGRGLLTRNEAHGSPGNWLDLYAAADIPETEMFYQDRNKLVSKFASSAAHVTGKNLVAAETGTWLKEHFTETLADMKYLADDMFLSGVNHIFYHGTCYSPDEAGWPGWLFYASYEMNPRNSVWRDVSALNAYVTRCQSVLQAGTPDNDVLLYWPIHDLWHNHTGRVRNLTVHARDWFEDQAIGKAATQLWNRGFAFDYISDRQLAQARFVEGKIKTSEQADYSVVVVPRTVHMPLPAVRRCLELAQAGATVVFEGDLPADVPGRGDYQKRHEELGSLTRDLTGLWSGQNGFFRANVGKGRLFKGDLQACLAAAGVPRESLFDTPGLMCVRRLVAGERFYFIANRSAYRTLNDWLTLTVTNSAVNVLDPLSGRIVRASLRSAPAEATQVHLALEPGESVILRCVPATKQRTSTAPATHTWEPAGPAAKLECTWDVRFVQGGPALPAPFRTSQLGSWTECADTKAQCFAGTAAYSATFDAPAQSDGVPQAWRLDLGKVSQSARMRLNGEDLGTLIVPPFRVITTALKPKGNQLEIEVTNVSANRIRDLDRRKVPWKNFYDINFVNLAYKPFDAADWPLCDSGLLGPVTLTPLK